MALSVAVDSTPPSREPRARDFVRLKLRLMRNGFRGQTWRIVFFTIGAAFSLGLAVMVFFALAGTGTSVVTRDGAFVWTSLAGTAVVLGWTLVPLLFFGVDETIDPARFALLPVPNRVLIRGMLAAAFVGVPAIATLIGSGGLVVGAWLRFGLAVAPVALVGVALGLTVGVLASRAVTSAFAALLRSRKVRDLAIVSMAVFASSIGPLQLLGFSVAEHGSFGGALRLAEVLGWTPLAAPYVLVFDLAEGRWLAALLKVGIALATIGVLRWWWSSTLESAMIGVSSNAALRANRGPVTGGVVATLLMRGVRGIMPANQFGAIMARESRSWWRDARRRASLISIVMASAVLPFSLSLAGGVISQSPGLRIGYGFAVTMAGTMGGMLLGNQFAYDGSAYATHLLTMVPGRVELRARAAALAMVVLPVQAVVVVAVTIITGTPSEVPAALGLLATGFGAAIAAAGVLSIFAAYPMPDSSNPFALNSGGGGAKGLLALVAMLATLVISSPVTVAANAFGHGAGVWLILSVGVAYGLLIAVFGTRLCGQVLDRRGPELLVAITPRR